MVNNKLENGKLIVNGSELDQFTERNEQSKGFKEKMKKFKRCDYENSYVLGFDLKCTIGEIEFINPQYNTEMLQSSMP